MNKHLALEEAKRLYNDNLVKIEEAEKICKKAEPLLPKDWYSAFHTNSGQLEFTRPGEADAVEFRVMCDHVEKIVGLKLHRGVGKSFSTYLYAWNWYYPEGKNIHLEIRVELNRPMGCKVTYKRKWDKHPVVDNECLGIRKEKEARAL